MKENDLEKENELEKDKFAFSNKLKIKEKVKKNLNANEERTDYNEIFKFLNTFVQEIRLDLYKFDKICDYLVIPIEIKRYAKDLLIKQEERFNNLRSREKFLIYFAAFFVSYVIVRCEYNEFKKKIDSLLKIFNNNRVYITRYVDLNRMLKIISSNRYHQYLITPSLTQAQINQYIANIYKIEIKYFFENIKNSIDFSMCSLNFEDLIEPILFIIKNCNENYEKFRKSRYSSACYFILSKIKKLQRVNIDIDTFFRSIKLSKRTFLEHLERINRNLDYQDFVFKFPNLELIEKTPEDFINPNQKRNKLKYKMYKKKF